MKYDYPLVRTTISLTQAYKSRFEDDVVMLAFPYKMPIYKWYVHPNLIWQPFQVSSNTKKILYEIAAAHKWMHDDHLKSLLVDEADKMRSISLGSVITNQGYKNIIESAIESKDTFELEHNYELRFLNNPKYYWGENYDNREEIRRKLMNEYTANEKSLSTHNNIKKSIADYDLNRKKLTKVILADDCGLSVSSIKNYLNGDDELNAMFNIIRNSSGTSKQLNTKRYNANKLVKQTNLKSA